MSFENKYELSKEEKETFMDSLTPQLPTLRTKAEISQEELANLIGVSRQTYGAIERGTQPLTWNTYLSLILFYDYCENTHEMLRAIGAFPNEVIFRFNQNDTLTDSNLHYIFGNTSANILEHLDAKALHAIRTVIMLEYARCTKTSGETVIKSFDGINFGLASDAQTKAKQSLKRIEMNNGEQG